MIISAEFFDFFGVIPYQGGFPENIVSSRQVNCSVCDRECEVLTIFRRKIFLCIESSSMDFPTPPIFPAPQCLRQEYHHQIPPRSPAYIQCMFQVKISDLNDGALAGLSQKKKIFHLGTKRNHWSFEWFSETQFVKKFFVSHLSSLQSDRS